MTVSILEDRRENLSASALVAWISGFAALKHSPKVFAYSETLAACTLTSIELSAWTVPDLPMEGRVFGERGDVRWRCLPDGRFNGWSIREVDKDVAGASVREYADNNYYLVGRGTTEPGQFTEARYPGVLFNYPIESVFNEAEAPNARGFVTVREYGPVKPDDSTIQKLAADQVVQLLNQPRLIAHRFVYVRCDTGSK